MTFKFSSTSTLFQCHCPHVLHKAKVGAVAMYGVIINNRKSITIVGLNRTNKELRLPRFAILKKVKNCFIICYYCHSRRCIVTYNTKVKK